MSLLTVKELSVAIGDQTLVDKLSFTVERGQTVAIIGESGSGKTVSLMALLGLLNGANATAQKANFNEQCELLNDPAGQRKLLRSQIGLVRQEPMSALNPYQTIGAQITEVYDGPLPARQRAAELLEEVGIADARQRLDDYPHQFSGGMRQRVLIAMALVNDPQLLICDEPTTALDVTVQSKILLLLRQLQQQRGLGLVVVSHDLAVVASLANHILVMRGGACVESGTPETLLTSPSHPYTAALIAAQPKPHQRRHPDCEALLTAEAVTVWRGQGRAAKAIVKAVSLSVGRGEVVGLVGESGSGKSTLGRALLGLLPLRSGQLLFNGKQISAGRLRGDQRQAMQLVFQDPLASLNPRFSIFQTLAEPLRLYSTEAVDDLSAQVQALAATVELAPQLLQRRPAELSGGQRQRVAIARALACKPRLLVADEPVSALDLTVQAEILQLLRRLVDEQHLGLLFISHDLGVVRAVADRVAVMQGGRLVEQDDTQALWRAPSHPYTKQLLNATLAL